MRRVGRDLSLLPFNQLFSGKKSLLNRQSSPSIANFLFFCKDWRRLAVRNFILTLTHRAYHLHRPRRRHSQVPPRGGDRSGLAA